MLDKIFPKIHNEGYKFLVIFALATIVLYFIHGFLGFIGFIFTIWVYYFFRDPERISINNDNYLTSPADGLVVQVLETNGPKELGLEEMNVSPRFSYQFANTRLPTHVDIDNIVGLNMNLMDDHVPDIHLNNRPYFYECMLVDVGGIKHSVESVPYARLIFKLAIREPWAKIYNALKNKGLVDPDLTICINPDLKEYISIAPTKENELWKYLPPNDMRRK